MVDYAASPAKEQRRAWCMLSTLHARGKGQCKDYIE
jgi:hypothetical protein